MSTEFWKALEYVLEHGEFQDEGPCDEGWTSLEMSKALDLLKEELEKHEQRISGN